MSTIWRDIALRCITCGCRFKGTLRYGCCGCQCFCDMCQWGSCTQHELNSDRLCKEVINIYTRLTLTRISTVVILLSDFKRCQSPHCSKQFSFVVFLCQKQECIKRRSLDLSNDCLTMKNRLTNRLTQQHVRCLDVKVEVNRLFQIEFRHYGI